MGHYFFSSPHRRVGTTHQSTTKTVISFWFFGILISLINCGGRNVQVNSPIQAQEKAVVVGGGGVGSSSSSGSSSIVVVIVVVVVIHTNT